MEAKSIKLGGFKGLFNMRRKDLSLDEFKTVDDTTSEDFSRAKEEILQAFIQFLIAKQHNKIDFTNLSEENLAILKETNLDLGLRTKSSEFYQVQLLTRENIFVIYHNVSDFEFTRGASNVKLKNGRSEKFAWCESPKVDFTFLDIDIDKAIRNLSQLTLLRGSDEQKEKALSGIKERVIFLIREALQGKDILDITSNGLDFDTSIA